MGVVAMGSICQMVWIVCFKALAASSIELLQSIILPSNSWRINLCHDVIATNLMLIVIVWACRYVHAGMCMLWHVHSQQEPASTCWSFSILLLAMTVLQPCRMNSSAILNPIPEAPPVMKATLPRSRSFWKRYLYSCKQ